MMFQQAADFRLPFGKHIGKSLDEIAVTDEGLLYLDWLRGEKPTYTQVMQALTVYLTDRTIATELERLVRR